MAEIKEACGVFGIYDLDGGNVVPSIYYGLTSLQHRGQESCGLAVCRTDGEQGNVSGMCVIPQQELLWQKMHSLLYYLM